MQFHELKSADLPTETRFIFGRKVVVTDSVPGGPLESRVYVVSGELSGDPRADAYSELIALTTTGEHKTIAGARTWAKKKTGAA
jgi:hypothetical protein